VITLSRWFDHPADETVVERLVQQQAVPHCAVKARPNRRHRLLEVTDRASRQSNLRPTASLDAVPAHFRAFFRGVSRRTWDARRLANRLKEHGF
jgi:hypothetical protein